MLRVRPPDALLTLRGGPVLVLLAVSLPLVVGDCRLDFALVTHVPPNAAHVVRVSECGGLKCWDRWVEIDGKRVGETRACSESETSRSGDRFTITPSHP